MRGVAAAAPRERVELVYGEGGAAAARDPESDTVLSGEEADKQDGDLRGEVCTASFRLKCCVHIRHATHK